LTFGVCFPPEDESPIVNPSRRRSIGVAPKLASWSRISASTSFDGLRSYWSTSRATRCSRCQSTS
jgi:hypothetical protein